MGGRYVRKARLYMLDARHWSVHRQRTTVKATWNTDTWCHFALCWTDFLQAFLCREKQHASLVSLRLVDIKNVASRLWYLHARETPRFKELVHAQIKRIIRCIYVRTYICDIYHRSEGESSVSSARMRRLWLYTTRNLYIRRKVDLDSSVTIFSVRSVREKLKKNIENN